MLITVKDAGAIYLWSLSSCRSGFASQLKDLMEPPSQKSAVSARKVLALLGVAVAGATIVSGIYLSRKK
ncbi:hypothetical protein OIU77_006814 [Salix suchowensis]|uniref:Uncharacterized protein n=1 Tax=Salix suchowensis TaxID=1278906 RepID=A0ABQ9ALZ2_9ROSI|nr:hypothetical protein OIU77_006814 [Salix suchowensis]